MNLSRVNFCVKLCFYPEISLFTVTLDELQDTADNMRLYTADAMKIEVASWIKDYVVDMEELYTELALEKIHNKATGQHENRLHSYQELFDKRESKERVDAPDFPQQKSLPVKTSRKDDHISSSKEAKSKKILMKADPGMGKTTQCKKISWD